VTTLTVRAVVYDSPTLISAFGHVFAEIVGPGALTPALAKPNLDVVCLRDHNPSLLLGRTRSRTLTLRHDSQGLLGELNVPATQLGDETVELVRRGDLAGASFAFQVRKDSWTEGPGGMPVREIEEISQLEDISICTLPAYEATSVGLRSQTSPVSEKWIAQAAARRRQLQLLEAEDGELSPVAHRGKRIARPSWWKTSNLTRRGCGHVGGLLQVGVPS
jgi:Escherichia/Staphylococcus phage prohead protease